MDTLSAPISLGCPNCGDPSGVHFVPPSLGEAGFFICDRIRSGEVAVIPTTEVGETSNVSKVALVDDTKHPTRLAMVGSHSTPCLNAAAMALLALGYTGEGVGNGLPLDVAKALRGSNSWPEGSCEVCGKAKVRAGREAGRYRCQQHLKD